MFSIFALGIVLNRLYFFIFFYLTLIGSFAANAQLTNKEIENKITAINAFALTHRELLPQKEVITLSTSIIQNRRFFDNNTIAKVFILLSDIATNQGDNAKAFQFANDGMALTGIDKKLQLNLMLKIAAGNYINGKFDRVLRGATQIIKLSYRADYISYRLIAISYKAMAHALLGQHQLAFEALQEVESLLAQHKEFSDHSQLLEILSTAYSYQKDYETAITLYNKLLKIKFAANRRQDIDKIYADLARAYKNTNRLDDAYNAFWLAKQYAEQYSAKIRIAYAELGLGEVLLQQNKYNKSYESLIKAEALFKGQNLTGPHLSTLIALAKAAYKLNKQEDEKKWLLLAKPLADNVHLTREQIQLYALMSAMYYRNNKIQLAWEAQNRHIKLFQALNTKEQNSYIPKSQSKIDNDSRLIAMNLAEETDLKLQFSEKLMQQQNTVNLLSVLICFLIIIIVLFMLRQRTRKQQEYFQQVDLPKRFFQSAYQTKELYQTNYKMARRFEYPLTIGYLSIDNWTELSFRFNKKVVQEVCDIIESLIVEYTDEFDLAGLINNGEYLLLSPHQNTQSIESKLQKLADALKVRFFANLGDFSVKINYAFATPTIQDIDPYIFLSQLSDKVHDELIKEKNGQSI